MNEVGPICFKIKKLFRLADSIEAETMSDGADTHGTARDILNFSNSFFAYKSTLETLQHLKRLLT